MSGSGSRTLGLGRYEATFRESEIDADVLPDLTDLDLEKLGMPLGHRKRLLKAIASLGAVLKLPTPLVTTSAPPALARSRQARCSPPAADAGLRLGTEGFDTPDLKEAKALLAELTHEAIE